MSQYPVTPKDVAQIAFINLNRLQSINDTFKELADTVEARLPALTPSEQRFVESQDISVENYRLMSRLIYLLGNAVEILHDGERELTQDHTVAISNAPKVMKRAEQMLSCLTGKHVVRPTLQKLLGSKLQIAIDRALFEITISRYNLSFLYSPVFCEMLHEYNREQMAERQRKRELAFKQAIEEANKKVEEFEQHKQAAGIHPSRVIDRRYTYVH